MFKVRTPLSREVAEWALARGFGLWDWASMPVVADAAREELGDEAGAQLLDHGRWLVQAQVQALCRPLWTYPGGAWDFKPMSAWSAPACEAIRASQPSQFKIDLAPSKPASAPVKSTSA